MMEEIPKLDSPCCSNSRYGVGLESEEKSMNTFQYTTEKDDSFVIDMDSFSSATLNKDNNTTNANSRIITRSLSRKGSQRGGERKMNGNATALHDKDVNVIPAICSPKATLAGSITLEKPAAVMAVGSTDHSISPHVHHQIGITANSSTNSTNENKGITRRNSFRRTSSSWTLDPKRVLLLFATLSSMGTMVLIYFTFIINKQHGDHEYGGN